MARPLLGSKPRVRINLMIDPDQLAELDRRRGTTSRSAYITALIDRPAVASPTGGPPPDTKKQQVSELQTKIEAKIATGKTGCTHPRTERKVHSWGATCGLCNTRLP